MTPDIYCKRRCPIKEIGKCNPKICRIVPSEDIAVQKAFDSFPLELKRHILKDKNLVFIKCGKTIWATMKEGKLRNDAEKWRILFGLPSYITIEEDKSIEYIQ